MKLTTISVRPETRDKLAVLGHKGQSWDKLLVEILEKLLKEKNGFVLKTKMVRVSKDSIVELPM